MQFNWHFPYQSQRMPVMASNIVATSQPLAAEAGLNIIRDGGNAVDAAIATAITLTVVEPVNNGLGGDAFAIVWDGKRLQGINGSGKSPRAWNYDYFSAKYKQMPRFGWDSITVPGAVSVWVELSRRYGNLPFERLFDQAVHYAENGYPVSPITAGLWREAESLYQDFPGFKSSFLPYGIAPETGEVFRCVDMARSLEDIGWSEGDSFYQGEIAKKIAKNARISDGMLSYDDLAEHEPIWVTPIEQNYRDYALAEIPPNGQGIAALIALGILSNFNLAGFPVDSADSLHIQIEAMKLAFADIKAHLADPEFMKVTCEQLLNNDYLKARSNLINMKRASKPVTGIPHDKGTVYLTTADSDGMMVSFIQSNFWGFGSGVVIPGTGIAMQNRGYGFSLEKDHPNRVDGGKRPYHTIIPGFVTRDGQPVMSFGVMGGHMQPQGQVQLMTRIFDYEQNPQAAVDAPRWFITEVGKLAVEPGFSPDVLGELKARGHDIVTDIPQRYFGGAQLIYKLDKCYLAASDPRKDGLAVGF